MNAPNLPFQSEAFRTTWQLWVEYRKENGLKPYKPVGLAQVLKGLVRKAGNNEQMAIRIIEQSMENGWRGLFPLKNYGTSTINTNRGTSGSRMRTARDW